MKNLLAVLLIAGISTITNAQDFSGRAAATYLETDKNVDIDCYYSNNKTFKLITPLNQTQKSKDQISRNFLIETTDHHIPMSFVLERTGRSFDYHVILNNKHLSTKRLARRDFFIAPINDTQFSSEFETSKIFCNVNFAYAYPYDLQDGNYHISVHPHKTYDWQSRLTVPIERYLNNNHYKSIILLEAGNYRGNLVDINKFLDNVEYQLPATEVDSDLENVPVNIPLIVSPAGNNRFNVKAEKELNITFTGGNHNYCIWNSTRHVLEGLMQSKSKAKVNFHYDTQAIVAQVRGIERMGMNFSRGEVKRSNLLEDLLSNKSIQHNYHQAYLNYFSNYLAREYAGMYKTYKINYKAEGYENSVILNGQGKRDLEVSFNYL